MALTGPALEKEWESVAMLPGAQRLVEHLLNAGVPVAAYLCPNLGHGLDDMCIQLGMEFLAEMFGVDVLSVAGMTP